MSKSMQERLQAFQVAKASMRALARMIETDKVTPRMEMYKEIGKDFDVTHHAIRSRYMKWVALGDEALMPKPSGRKKGDGKRITDEEEEIIKTIIIDKTPAQIKMPFALWSCKSVRDLILQECGVTYQISAVGKYLKRWGFTVQKPTIKKHGQQPKAVQKWLAEEYPAIVKQAAEEGGMIWWGDETAVQNDQNQLRGYSLKGKTPVAPGPSKKLHLHMVSAVNNQGLVHFKIYKDAVNVERFTDFMESMIKDAEGRKIFLVVDNLPVHHANILKPWREMNIDLLELKFLPSYSPELNPDEYLNRDMKSRLANKPVTSCAKELERRVGDYMGELSNNEDLVASFFEHGVVKYAATA
jgi:transposase